MHILDGTSSEPPTAGITNYNAWNDLASSRSTTRTELSISDGHVDDEVSLTKILLDVKFIDLINQVDKSWKK